MTFNVQKCHIETRIFRNILLWEGDTTTHILPPLGRSAPSLCPLYKNSGYTTATGVAKKAQWNAGGGGEQEELDWYCLATIICYTFRTGTMCNTHIRIPANFWE